MKIKYFLLLFSSLFTLKLAASVDSIPWYKRFDANVVFSFERHGINEDLSINEPEYIIDQRVQQRQFSYPTHTYSQYTDNPFLHFASFAGLQLDYHLNNSFTFHGDLYGEHRGFSYGHLSKGIVRLFPQIYIEGHDTLSIFGEEIELQGKLGDLIQHTVNYGLTISNNDFQGGSVMGKWKGFYFRYLILADAALNIGLNLNEFWSYKIGWENPVFNNKGVLNIALFRDQLILAGLQRDPAFHYGIALGYRTGGWKFFGESSIRNQGGYFIQVPDEAWNHRLGFIAGLYRKWNWGDDESISLYFDLRHYGKYFNTNYEDKGRVSYREKNESFTGNFVGDQFYPLKNFYRPFREWSVFTQIQNSALLASSIQINLQKKVWKDFHFNGAVETLFMDSDEVNSFFYNFFNVGLSYNGFTGFKLEGFVSNKIMNLDVGFQTFYQATTPFIGYRCIRWFGEGGDPGGRRMLD